MVLMFSLILPLYMHLFCVHLSVFPTTIVHCIYQLRWKNVYL